MTIRISINGLSFGLVFTYLAAAGMGVNEIITSLAPRVQSLALDRCVLLVLSVAVILFVLTQVILRVKWSQRISLGILGYSLMFFAMVLYLKDDIRAQSVTYVLFVLILSEAISQLRDKLYGSNPLSVVLYLAWIIILMGTFTLLVMSTDDMLKLYASVEAPPFRQI